MGGGASSPYLAVLDVDSGYSEFLVLQFGAVVFSRSIGVGAHHLLNDRARWEEKFVQEVAHALEAYRAESSGAALAGLGLSGAGMRVGWLGDRLRAGLDLAVTPHDCLVEVPPAPGVPAVTDAPYRELSLTALIGAAVDHARLTVNLTPDSVRARRALAGKARALAGFGMLAMAVLSLGSAWIVTQRFQRDARLRILKSQIDATAQEAQEIELMRRKVDLVAARLDAGPPPVNLLSELHALVPPPIYVTSLQMEQGGAIVIRGVADGVAEAVSDILRFVSALEASPHFENAKATRTATVRGKTEFEVTCGAEYRAP
jgi:Tfp pilus assembly protein PilN